MSNVSITYHQCKLGMWVFIIVQLIFIPNMCLAEPATGKDDDKQMKEKLTWLSKQIVQHAEDMETATALSATERIGEVLLDVKVDKLTSIEGYTCLLELVLQVKQTFSRVSTSIEQRKHAAFQMQYAIDAFIQLNPPLWLQFEHSITKTLDRMKRDVEKKNWTDVRIDWANYMHQIDVIYPAIVISRPPTLVTKFDSIMKFVDQQLQEQIPNPLLVMQAVQHVQQVIEELLAKPTAQFTAVDIQSPNSLFPAAWYIGCIIFVVLLYASYRMSILHRMYPRSIRIK